jgi:amphi-Trp domain-containing protein
MPPKDKVQFSGTVPAQEAAQYLESLAKGIRERTMLLESGDASVTIEVPDEVKIEIDVSSDAEKGKSSVDVSLGFRRRGAETPAAPGLLIVPGAAAAESSTFAE